MTVIRTALAAEHERAGAQMVNFSGYWMPIQYGSILDEVRRVRTQAGLFDLCHMGRVRIRGAEAIDYVDRLVTCDVRKMDVGMIRYALLTREDGTTIDDVLVYREPETVFLCINAGNRNRDLAWLRTHAAGTQAVVDDLSDSLAMIAIQGPNSADVMRGLCADDPDRLGYYRFFTTDACGLKSVMVSRTGYTGEDGFELYLPVAEAPRVWNALLEAGKAAGVTPIGLGARDCLRLEAGMPLYGHEIDDTTNPVEANLMRGVKRSFEFVGGDAVRRAFERGPSRRLVGFTMEDRRVPRMGYAIYAGDAVAGDVRSGTFSPTLGKSIGTAYVTAERAAKGTRLDLDLRGHRAPIEIVDLPFYERPRRPRMEREKS